MILTHSSLEELLEKGKRDIPSGAWNREQLAILGVKWPPRAGWKNDILGTELSAEDIDMFIALKTPRIKGSQMSKKEKKRVDKRQPMIPDFL